MNHHDDWLKAILCAAAPKATALIDNDTAMTEIRAAWALWAMSIASAQASSRNVTAEALFGSSKGAYRSKGGAADQLEDMRRRLEQLARLASDTREAFTMPGDGMLEAFAGQFDDAVADARKNISLAIAALKLIEDELIFTGKKNGPGNLADKQRLSFDIVAHEVADQWSCLNLPFPTGNARDGGLINFLDTLHEEAGAGPLKSVPALMATIRKRWG